MEKPVSIDDENLEPRISVALLPAGARKIGPGFWESFAWTLGLLVAQVVVFIFAVAGIRFAQFVFEFSGLDGFREWYADWVKPFAEVPVVMWLVLIVQASAVFYAALANHVRFAPAGFRSLGWRLPSIAEVFVTLLIALPMLLIGSSLIGMITAINPGLDWGLRRFEGQVATVPIWVSVVSIAIFPAVGEELFARGLIGRGLTARYPTWLAVLLTSLLFAAMHLNPAQSLAVIPLGIVLHCLYLISRTIWLPILLHFANNFLSILYLVSRQSDALPDWTRNQSGIAPVGLLVVSAGLVMTALLWLCELRRPDRPVSATPLASLATISTADSTTPLNAKECHVDAAPLPGKASIGKGPELATERTSRRRMVALLALALLIHVAGFLLLLPTP